MIHFILKLYETFNRKKEYNFMKITMTKKSVRVTIDVS